ncbi:restriction endonuclease subunit S [Myceligenerans salitolerans]|uniref:Restriction endonuclease subunit S n=1 Tax=Myceligenerans salitolerans TaxID=1230528 RepID=A0ABS3ICM9_9MICO|nr:restriction endonuclease subunit S [Myceligenerans salitolerans]MBO0610685.1 restriction endonuclease subunit S [Myceligenerans salitolerans]
MSEWEKVPAGTVATQRKDVVKLKPGVEYRTMGVRWYGKGAYDRGIGTTETIKAKRLFRAHAGDFVFNRIDTQNGAFDVVPEALAGALATNEFPLYSTNRDRLSERFLLLYFQQQSVLAQIDAMRAGSEGRSRWKEADFEAWRIPLPSPAEQRRIVDVMAAVDAQIDALSREAKTSSQAAIAIAEDSLAEYERVPLDPHLERIEGGRSPMTTGEQPSDGERGVLKVSAVTPFQFVAEESKALSTETVMPRAAEVLPGDVLITRANTPERVGAVCRVPGSVREGLYLSDKTLRMVPKETLDPDYLVVAMALRSSRHHLRSSATGTSASMFNVSQAKIRSTLVPLPNAEFQKAVARVTMASLESASGLQEELVHLRSFRSALLTSLLNQEIEIPESYDALLEGVT